MARGRELSQLGSLISVDDSTKNIGVATATPSQKVGIGTNSPTSKVEVVGDVFVSGIITATSFSGDGSNLSNIISGVGIQSAGISVGTGVTTLNFIGAGNTFAVNGNSVDISISGGGASVSIGTEAPSNPSSGDLWYSSIHGRTFIYYDDDTSAQWVDAAPFNIPSSSSSSSGASVSISTEAPSNPSSGDIWYSSIHGRTFIYYDDDTSSQWVDSAPFNIASDYAALNTGTASSPGLYFSGDSSTGLFSQSTGQQTFVSVGSSILNINPSGINVTGVSTFQGDVRATSFSGSGVNLTGIVTSISAGSGISIDQSTGNVTITSTGGSGIDPVISSMIF